ncbi:hypothetical protein [Streptomyces sp. NPDC054854]
MITVEVRHRGHILRTIVAGQLDVDGGAVLVQVWEQVTGYLRVFMLDLYGVILMDRAGLSPLLEHLAHRAAGRFIPPRGLPAATGQHRRETRTARGC